MDGIDNKALAKALVHTIVAPALRALRTETLSETATIITHAATLEQYLKVEDVGQSLIFNIASAIFDQAVHDTGNLGLYTMLCGLVNDKLSYLLGGESYKFVGIFRRVIAVYGTRKNRDIGGSGTRFLLPGRGAGDGSFLC